MGLSLMKRRDGDQKLSPVMKISTATTEVIPPMVKTVLIIELIFLPE